MTLPISAIVPTRDRALALRQALESLAAQGILPLELIVVDGSRDTDSRRVVEDWALRVASHCAVVWQPATQLGAAVQRNQAVAAATQPFVWFFDDDILFEPECVIRLWHALQSDPKIGGVNAMIVNQRYLPPGAASRMIFTLMHGRREKTFAGRVIGPAVNLLPEDREDLPEIVPVEWLNLGCTIYRREVLPDPLFASQFTGYSLMEDVTLSLMVGRTWNLANARTARIYHNSQPGSYKSNVAEVACMQLVNRHYVMTRILGRTRATDYMRLLIWELFQLAVCAARSDSRSQWRDMCRGKFNGLRQICSKFSPANGSQGSASRIPRAGVAPKEGERKS